MLISTVAYDKQPQPTLAIDNNVYDQSITP